MKKEKIKNLDLEIFYEKLDNGLQILVVPMPNVNNIYATFSTKYGSNKIEFVPIDEKKMIKVPLGIAHFLEHKLFETKDGVDPFTFYSERGSDANANTDQKKTTYLFSGPSFFEENINYLLNYVQEPYLTDENVEKEKGIITQEIKMYLDDPYTIMYEGIIKNTFDTHPMKYPIIGSIDSINSITKEDLFTCYNTFYHPSNMFVVITGNVDAEKVIKIIKENQDNKQYEKIKKIDIQTYNEQDEVAKSEETISLNVSIPKCVVGYKLKIKNKETLYQDLLYLSTLFDIKMGATSEFVKQLLDDQIINNNLSIDFIDTEDHILFIVAGETYKPEELINRIKQEMKNINIIETDFERKKKTLLSSLVYMSDNLFQLNEGIMSDIIRYGKYNFNRYEDVKNLNFKQFNELVKNTKFNQITTFTVNPK